MKLFHFRIIHVMTFVAVAALNLGAMRELFGSGRHDSPIQIWGPGALLMANVLLVGFLIGYRRRGGHRFLWGFESSGTTALACYIAGASLYAEELVRPFVELVISPLADVLRVGPYITTSSLIIIYATLAVILSLPLVVIALVGGFLFRNFRLSRSLSEPPATPDNRSLDQD